LINKTENVIQGKDHIVE